MNVSGAYFQAMLLGLVITALVARWLWLEYRIRHLRKVFNHAAEMCGSQIQPNPAELRQMWERAASLSR